jgi:Domain of unknown function (DUF4105)
MTLPQAPSSTDIPDVPAPSRGLLRRTLRVLAIALIVFVLSILNFWAALAIYFSNLNGADPRLVMTIIFVISIAAAAIFIRPRRHAALACLIGFFVVLAWYFSIKPSNDRDWAPDVDRVASIQIDGNQLKIHNVRNFDYRSETSFTPIWEDRTYDLNKVKSADFTLCYWGSKAIAHGIVSFGFDDGRYLAVSIETRKQKSQSFSTIEGFFREYELIYIVSDERDVIRLRTNYRKEDLYLYQSRMNPAEARAVLLSYVESINSLRDQPQFYNALTSNCVTEIVPHARAGHPDAHIGWQLLLSGYAARQAYQNGNLDTSMPFEQLEARSHINAAAMAADQDPDFSNRIRIGLPNPAKDGSAENTKEPNS